MSEEQLAQILAGVPVSRRTFVRRMVLGTAFAVPVVASFGMGTARAGKPTTSNQPAPEYCTTPNQDGTGGQYYTPYIEDRILGLVALTDSLRPQSMNITAREMLHALQACNIARVKRLKTRFDAETSRALAKNQITQAQYNDIEVYADDLDRLLSQHGTV